MDEPLKWIRTLLEREWHVSRRVPISLTLIALIAASLTWYGTSSYYAAHYQERLKIGKELIKSKQNEIEKVQNEIEKVQNEYRSAIIEQEKTLSRYKQILGLEKNTKSTLLELTNKDLKQKGILLVQEIRKLNDHFEKEVQELKQQHDRKELDETQLSEKRQEVLDRAGKEFDENLNTQALVTMAELRNRVPKEKRGQFLSLPDIKSADSRDPSVSLHDVFPQPFTFFFSRMLANEIEKLTTLLPD